ncbi:MAG: CHAT domain-containing protein [Bacteroidetes bacterium]|nr:CHAT domain-containing protein [Bacteroidota bacterium]
MKQLFALCTLVVFIQHSFSQNYKQLQTQATSEAEKGNFSKAITLSESAIELAKKNISPSDLLILKSENAMYYLLDEQVDKGKSLMRPLLKEVESSNNFLKASFDVHQNYGNALSYLGNYNDAIEYLSKALELSKRIKITALEQNNLYAALANSYNGIYDFNNAELNYLQAIDLCKKENLANTNYFAENLSGLASLYVAINLHEDALNYFEQAEKIYTKTNDTITQNFTVFLEDYGIFLAKKNQNEKALDLLFRAKNIIKVIFSENSNPYSVVLGNIAFVYNLEHKNAECEQFYMQALKIKKNLAFVRKSDYLTTINNIILFYNEIGRTESAKILINELNEALNDKNFTDTLSRAIFSRNLGAISKSYDESVKYFQNARLYYETIFGSENNKVAEMYLNLALLHSKYKNYTLCVENLNKATMLYQNLKNAPGTEAIFILCKFASIYKYINKPELAVPILDKANEIIIKNNIVEKDVLEHLYIHQALIYADVKNIKESINCFNKYLELKYSQINQDFSYMTEDEKIFYLDEFDVCIKNFFTTVYSNIDNYPNVIKNLLDFKIKTKAFLLNNLTKMKREIIELNDPELNEKFERLKLKREAVSKLMNFNTVDYPNALAEASKINDEADIIEKELSLKVSNVALKNNTLNWQSIQKQLLPNEVAIEIIQNNMLYKSNNSQGVNYTYLLIKSTGNPIYTSIDEANDWENEMITKYRNSIEEKKIDTILYDYLWKKVELLLNGINTIYVSTDGIYNQINLNTLYNAHLKKHIIEYNNIHLVTSLRDIVAIKSEPNKSPKTSSLFGDPVFDYDLTRLNEKKENTSNLLATRGAYGFVLNSLPGTKSEIEAIENTLSGMGVKTSVFMKENASENEIKKINSPTILHIATHGFFIEEPSDNALKNYSTIEKTFYKNPMMRSGIFLSGANKTYSINTENIRSINNFEDGMLTAYEAMNLNLDKTDLVVLSACQTGLGKIKNGEGVFGLQRAFKLAGAKAIVMSLWPVSDEATKDLMVNFYTLWAKTGNLYQSFKDAQLDVKKKYPDPYYWGAFILNGK